MSCTYTHVLNVSVGLCSFFVGKYCGTHYVNLFAAQSVRDCKCIKVSKLLCLNSAVLGRCERNGTKVSSTFMMQNLPFVMRVQHVIFFVQAETRMACLLDKHELERLWLTMFVLWTVPSNRSQRQFPATVPSDRSQRPFPAT